MKVEPKRAELVFRIFRSSRSFEFVSNFRFRVSNFLFWLVFALFVVPAPASAHLTNTGLGPFYDGCAHLFMTPEDLLPVLGLALLGGLRGPRGGRAVLFVLPTAWLAGSIAGLLIAPQVVLPAVPAAAIAAVPITLGACVAGDVPLPLTVVGGLAVTLGLLNGGLDGIDLAKVHASSLSAAGVACALFVVVALLAGHIVSLRAQWARLVVRVAGSWIAAIGLLMLGWAVRGA